MTTTELLQRLRESRNHLESEYRVRIAGLFGSYARSEQRPASDVDILVDPQEGATLFDLGGLNTELEALLGCRVDVVSSRGLREELKPGVLDDLIPL
jgi:hypothetical protein